MESNHVKQLDSAIRECTLPLAPDSKHSLAAQFYFNGLSGQYGYYTQRDVARLFGSTESTVRKHWLKIKGSYK